MNFINDLGKAVLILILLSTAIFGKMLEGEKLALLAKPAVVRIYDGYIGTATWQHGNFTRTYNLSHVGAGSGAFIESNGYIVTNAHVVSSSKEGKDEGLKNLYLKFAALVAAEYKMTLNQLSETDWAAIESAFRRSVKYKQINNVVISNGESFPFEIKSYGASIDKGKDVAIVKIEIENAPILKLTDSGQVRVQDHVTVIGYPAAANSPYLDEKSMLQPSITDGKISALKNSVDGFPVFEVSAAATHGNSGGPVVNDSGEIVGLLTFGGDRVNGQQVQGFNFVVTSNTVKEFLTQAGTTNDGGAADRSYREGLELYQNESYSAALKKFEKVKNLFPHHSEIQTLISECEKQKEFETDYGLWAVAAGVALLLVFAGCVLFATAALVLRYFIRRMKFDPEEIKTAQRLSFP